MRHIMGADHKIEMERRAILRKLALVVRDYDVVGIELLDILRFIPGGKGEGVDLGADDVGKENCVVTL
jgi:hypothetical protein